jgi:hypothetical protein
LELGSRLSGRITALSEKSEVSATKATDAANLVIVRRKALMLKEFGLLTQADDDFLLLDRKRERRRERSGEKCVSTVNASGRNDKDLQAVAHSGLSFLSSVRNDIIEKLKKLLSEGIRRESDVVYLLVEIRKLLDRNEYADPLLRLFCNWVAHIEISGARSGSSLILKEFDPEYPNAGEILRGPAHYSFYSFREHLGNCLLHFGLPTQLVEKNIDWVRFTVLYTLVVGECPILYTASSEELRYIKSVELITTGIHRLVKKEWRNFLIWKITLKNDENRFLMFNSTDPSIAWVTSGR